MIDEYIKRSDAVYMASSLLVSTGVKQVTADSAAKYAMGKLPAADVAPVVHAHWIDTGRSDGNDNYDFVCCRCKHTDIHSRQVKVPYCWFCGARMDEQEGQHDN